MSDTQHNLRQRRTPLTMPTPSLPFSRSLGSSPAIPLATGSNISGIPKPRRSVQLPRSLATLTAPPVTHFSFKCHRCEAEKPSTAADGTQRDSKKCGCPYRADLHLKVVGGRVMAGKAVRARTARERIEMEEGRAALEEQKKEASRSRRRKPVVLN